MAEPQGTSGPTVTDTRVSGPGGGAGPLTSADYIRNTSGQIIGYRANGQTIMYSIGTVILDAVNAAIAAAPSGTTTDAVAVAAPVHPANWLPDAYQETPYLKVAGSMSDYTKEWTPNFGPLISAATEGSMIAVSMSGESSYSSPGGWTGPPPGTYPD